MPATFQIQGLNNVLKNIDAYAKEVKQEIALELTDTGIKIEQQAKQQAPVDLGNLRQRIVATKEAELISAFKLQELRTERNRLIAETDHWVLSDTADATSAQTTYRQALRDITDSATSLDDVSWHTNP